MITHIKRLSAKERRAVTVKAVVELAAGQNPSDITTYAIAKRMGMTQGAVFRHFSNKNAILEASIEWIAEQLLSRVDKAVQAAKSPLAALEAMFMAHVEFVIEYPGVPRMLFGELLRAEDTEPKRVVKTFKHRYGERLHLLIEEGKTCEELEVDLDTEASAILFSGTIQGLVMQSLMASDVDCIRRDAPRVFAIYRRGIRRAQ